jgi:hypothetical protein
MFALDILGRQCFGETLCGRAGLSNRERCFPPCKPVPNDFLRPGFLEVVSILVRKRNDNRLSQDFYSQAILALYGEFATDADVNYMSVDDNATMESAALIDTYSLNASDAVILNMALRAENWLRSFGDHLSLWTSDIRLGHAANQEGLLAFNPAVNTAAQLKQLLGI